MTRWGHYPEKLFPNRDECAKVAQQLLTSNTGLSGPGLEGPGLEARKT